MNVAAKWMPIVRKILGDDARLVHNGVMHSLPRSKVQVRKNAMFFFLKKKRKKERKRSQKKYSNILLFFCYFFVFCFCKNQYLDVAF